MKFKKPISQIENNKLNLEATEMKNDDNIEKKTVITYKI